ncbi:MAG TPA: OsmC family peroxiredoxin [candidate division Zixibacteria bacterium]|nr:OsmC family peroxiredoxin [candidate division Zixibacteria bacterium]
MSTKEKTYPNGVNVEQLVDTINAIKENPELAQFNFRASTKWLDGGYSQTMIKGFYGAGQEDKSRSREFVMDGDEPPVLLGSNKAPNAVESVLHALASCLAVGFSYNAAAQGINVKNLEFDLEGKMDLHGFLGLSDQVRPGYKDINLKYRVDCDAPPEKVEELWAHVKKTSPVLDMLSNPVPVTISNGR